MHEVLSNEEGRSSIIRDGIDTIFIRLSHLSLHRMPSNSAAWLVAEKAHPLKIQTAPYNIPGDKEVLVKNAALAINPVDWALQASAIFPLKYPAIPGADIAGEVLEVGNGVTGFKKGDRVLAFALGSVNQTQSQGAFQEYTVMQQQLDSVIPDSLSFERAAVCHCVLQLQQRVCIRRNTQVSNIHRSIAHPTARPF